MGCSEENLCIESDRRERTPMPRGIPKRRRRRNGGGSVFFHKPSGLWCWQVTVIGRRLTGYEKTATAAERALAEAVFKGSSGMIADEDPLFTGWGPVWLSGKARNIAEKTRDSYALNLKHLNRFPFFLLYK